MKVWVKLFTGAVIGVILGIVLPFQESRLFADAIEFLPQLALRIGRYIAPPMIIFSLTIAIYDLRQDSRFWSLVGKTVLVILATSIIVLTFGISATRLLFSNGRIPIIVESAVEITAIAPTQSALELFPTNMLAVLSGDGLFIFPLCIFAFFMALGLAFEKKYTKPALVFFESLSQVFFNIGTFFSEVLGVVVIVLAAYSAWQYRIVLTKGIFSDFIKLILAITLVLSFIVLPLFLYLLRPQKKTVPWIKVYGSLGPAIAAFFSGDINFTLPVLFLHTKENLGVSRQANAVSPLLFVTIGRSGSAMIAAVSFIVILQSYSSLEITMDQIMQIWMRALLLSCMLGRNSGDGALMALVSLCLWAPEGFQTGYLILKPIGFFLIACATLIDCMAAMLGSYVAARLCPGGCSEKTIKHFV
jgi:Na+/H+-dicarboxylate symporter